ncbi:FAD-dependent oxidoreductase, partial [Mesorhizobium sp. M8A.F.Ca.ET.161.01.1.1]
MTKTLKCDVLVVGTGIIGSMAALYLQNAGRDVVLLERGD